MSNQQLAEPRYLTKYIERMGIVNEDMISRKAGQVTGQVVKLQPESQPESRPESRPESMEQRVLGLTSRKGSQQ